MDGGEAGGISAAESLHLHMADSDKSNSLIANKSLRHVELLIAGAVVRHLLWCLEVGVLALVYQLNGLVLCQIAIINVKLITDYIQLSLIFTHPLHRGSHRWTTEYRP